MLYSAICYRYICDICCICYICCLCYIRYVCSIHAAFPNLMLYMLSNATQYTYMTYMVFLCIFYICSICTIRYKCSLCCICEKGSAHTGASSYGFSVSQNDLRSLYNVYVTKISHTHQQRKTYAYTHTHIHTHILLALHAQDTPFFAARQIV